jgi:signal transduction histidine kinase
VLPELGELSASAAITLAKTRHENLTGTNVEADIRPLPKDIPDALKICLYRIVQESLSNSFRHAGGIGQRVEANWVDGTINVVVSDRGTGTTSEPVQRKSNFKFGHRGIRNRVQAFGGKVDINMDPTAGTKVSARIPFKPNSAKTT